ncbi:MAG: hypothetical protein M1838_002294 [Thelocarpon superellum]|nr:MAG: hypothetical protein M1838_002294 [Thelocarpon superellum]
MASLSAASLCAATYEYVIAGGGTAGLTLAARLTEDPKIRVAVLEAGQDLTDDLNVQCWGLTAGMLGDATYDWIYRTTPQADDDNRVISWPRGKQLGGSSAINLWIWNVASETDTNDWEALGNDGWGWADLFPYFLKANTFTRPPKQTKQDLQVDYIDPSVHGTNGPVDVSYATSHNTFEEAWVPTFESLGLGVNGDPYGGEAIGGFTTAVSQIPANVSRSYAANAYYVPNKNRPNLKLLTGAQVSNVIFKKQGKKVQQPLVATGLSFTEHGTSYIVNATREVVLSAGVVQSPQLLELSGIGDQHLLTKYGIDVLIDNANVGENMQDHQLNSLGFKVAPGQITLDSLSDPGAFPAALNKYLTNKSGILAEAASSVSYLSYKQLVKSSKSASTLPNDPDTYKPSAAAAGKNPGLAKQYELITEKLQDPKEASVLQLFLPAGNNYRFANDSTLLFTSPGPGSFVTFYGVAVHPYSRGSIHINSSDPLSYPVIDPRYLSNPLDVDVLETTALHLQTIATTAPFSSLLQDNGTVYETFYEKVTPQNANQHVKDTLNSLYHGVGTCAMEPRDKGGVVSNRLKVYGTSNLRVVDPSIAPMLTRGTIQSLVYGIAEKAADMMKQENGH